jgi:hypothetical protein
MPDFLLDAQILKGKSGLHHRHCRCLNLEKKTWSVQALFFFLFDLFRESGRYDEERSQGKEMEVYIIKSMVLYVG